MTGQDGPPDRCGGETKRQHEGLLGIKPPTDGATQHQSEARKQHQNAGNDKQQWSFSVFGFHGTLLGITSLPYLSINNCL